MVLLYVAGQKAGTLADADTLFPEFISRRVPVEFRNDAGELLARFTPIHPGILWSRGIRRLQKKS